MGLLVSGEPLDAETISLVALSISVISLIISLANRNEDQKVRVAEKLSELVVLIGQLQVAVQQHQTELSEAAKRTKKVNEEFSFRFEAMYEKCEGTIEKLSVFREKADVMRNISPPSKAIIEIERMKSELAVQQAHVVHLLQETKELSTLISNTEKEKGDATL